MGHSSYVKALISDQDPTYQKYSKVLRACLDAGVSKLPQEVANYFGSEYAEEYLFEEKLQVKIPLTGWSDGDMCDGYEIKVEDIPEGVKVIRFVNSW